MCVARSLLPDCSACWPPGRPCNIHSSLTKCCFARADHEEADAFELTPEGAEVLANDEDSLSYAAGAFHALPREATVDGLVEAFHTGIGLTYEMQGSAACHGTERMLGTATRRLLIPEVIPMLRQGAVMELLEQGGALVADVGCGAGVALNAMAVQYPGCTFHGYDPNSIAIARAKEVAAEIGLKNVEYFVEYGENVSTPAEGKYDLISTLDVIHDLPRPDLVIAAIHEMLSPDGTWLVK